MLKTLLLLRCPRPNFVHTCETFMCRYHTGKKPFISFPTDRIEIWVQHPVWKTKTQTFNFEYVSNLEVWILQAILLLETRGCPCCDLEHHEASRGVGFEERCVLILLRAESCWSRSSYGSRNYLCDFLLFIQLYSWKSLIESPSAF